VTNIFFFMGMPKAATNWLAGVLLPTIEGIEVRAPRRWSEIDLSVPKDKTLIVSARWMSGTTSDRKRPGFGCKVLSKSLKFINSNAPEAGVMIGFREHASWLQAAFSQKAKRRTGVEAQRYAESFSPEDLSWSWKLETIAGSRSLVFPFLYEEIRESPHEFIDDLCRFVGRSRPANIEALLSTHTNPSPRSRMGLGASRSLSKLSTNTRWKQASVKAGTWLDRYFPTDRVSLNSDLAADLRQDWVRLVRMVGESRKRDLDRFAQVPPAD
jgi:hypothetical protein